MPRLIKDPVRYKTILCDKWTTFGACPYKHKCQFAHGEAELRMRTQASMQEASSSQEQPVCLPVGVPPSAPVPSPSSSLATATPPLPTMWPSALATEEPAGVREAVQYQPPRGQHQMIDLTALTQPQLDHQLAAYRREVAKRDQHRENESTSLALLQCYPVAEDEAMVVEETRGRVEACAPTMPMPTRKPSAQTEIVRRCISFTLEEHIDASGLIPAMDISGLMPAMDISATPTPPPQWTWPRQAAASAA